MMMAGGMLNGRLRSRVDWFEVLPRLNASDHILGHEGIACKIRGNSRACGVVGLPVINFSKSKRPDKSAEFLPNVKLRDCIVVVQHSFHIPCSLFATVNPEKQA